MTSFPRELAHGYGAVMQLDSSRLLLAFRHLVDPSAVASALEDFNLVLEDAADRDEKRLGVPEPVNHTARRLWVRSRNGRTIRHGLYRELVAALERELDWVGPVYRVRPGDARHNLVCPLPHVLVIKPASPSDVVRQIQLTRLLTGLGFKEVREKSTYLGGYQYFQLDDACERTAYELEAVVRAERALVEEVHFEKMPMVAPAEVRPARPQPAAAPEASDPQDADDLISGHPPPLMLGVQLSAR